MRKRLTILTNGGGELANQLWNYLSVYAYGLHSKTSVSNPSFFEYHRHFRFIKNETAPALFFSSWFRGPVRRRSHPVNKFWRIVYRVYARGVRALHMNAIVSSQNNESCVTFLPPTRGISLPEKGTLYFLGWLFRNTDALTTYGIELREAFRPVDSVELRVRELITPLRTKKHVLGVHIRQSDYADFKGGSYLVSTQRMREIVDEYTKMRGFSPEDTALLVASDGPVEASIFSGYLTHLSKEGAVIDLFLLSHTDAVIGSNSSFGHFSSWFGNIPHVVAQNEVMDWEYYKDKTAYFPNKYATLARLT